MSLRIDLAVEAFRDLMRVERLVEKKRLTLNKAIIRLQSPEEVAEYMQRTLEIEKAYEEMGGR